MDAFTSSVPGREGGREEVGEVVASCFPEGQIYNSVSFENSGRRRKITATQGERGEVSRCWFFVDRRAYVSRLRDPDVRLAPLLADTHLVSTHFSPRILTKFPSFDPTIESRFFCGATNTPIFIFAGQTTVYPRTKLQCAFSSSTFLSSSRPRS